MNDVVNALRYTGAAALAVVAAGAGWAAVKLPMEAGGLVFGPVLIGASLTAGFGALRLALPQRWFVRRPATERDLRVFLWIIGALGVAWLVEKILQVT